jgi:hypothetical protein
MKDHGHSILTEMTTDYRAKVSRGRILEVEIRKKERRKGRQDEG